MRLSIAALAIAAALAAGLQPADAIHNARYCMQGRSGGTDCAFHTRQQCLASAHGLGGHCIENPRWHRPRQGGR
jgi:Protein of unknown function (DUF3551)